MAQKRISQLAKELGVASKAIVDKCRAEGISEDIVKGHMSTVSAGLEATIREWFSSEGTATAVETSGRVDISAVKARPRSRARARDADAPAPGDADTGVATAEPEPPAEIKAAPRARAPSAPAPGTPPPEPIPAARAPAPEAPPATPGPPAHPEPGSPAAPARKPDRPRPAAPVKPVPAAPMNVPTRPQVVTPAGPQLQVQRPVQLSGPKIVRVEAPEQVEAPRPRRVGPPDAGIPGSRGPRTGAGVGARPDAPADDDSARSPRRGGANKRRVGAVPERRRATSGDDAGAAWRQQDLIEREERLSRSGGFLKKKRQELKSRAAPGERTLSAAETGGVVHIAAPFTIKDLSAATGVKAAEICKKLFLKGVMASINSGIDVAQAQEIMIDYNIELVVEEAKTAEEAVSEEFGKREVRDLRPRGPVVTILGHVDHGKTSLLDKIRNTNVAAGEAGGITQKTSAFRVPVQVGGETKWVIFLDTPGHEAFTSMRARGATMTDVVVLVVSAPEGVMPQTIESINHARAAKVPIVVALNKIDRPDATEGAIQKTLRQLADAGLNPAEWGGDAEIVRTSAVTGQGIQDLLEVLDYQAQLLELKADFQGPARGTVIEARMDEGRGAMANLLVQDGCLRVGDVLVAGRSYGRVREILNDRGERIKQAEPPMPVQVTGLDEVPDAGDPFFVVDSIRKAEEAAEQRRQRERQAQLAQPKVTLDKLFSQMGEDDVKEILVVLKADVQGSLDVLKAQIEKVSADEVKVRVLHAGLGGITESDVLLAEASRAIIIGFNVIAAGKTRQLADQRGVEIRTYQVIYDIVDDVRKAAEGLLEPELRQEVLGHAEVRQVFKITRVGAVAGCYVTDGIVQRDARVRVTRNGVVVENDRLLEQLKRFKDDAKEVRAGMECGMKIAGYDDIKEGDVIECYKQVEVKRTLSSPSARA